MKLLNIFKNKEKGGQTATSSAPFATTTSINEKDIFTSKGPESSSKEKRRRVHNLIILDESGSMISIYKAALSGVNETLQTIRDGQKENPDQQHFVTLVTFDTGHYNEIYHGTPAEQALDITERQYHPNGGTPLYDAMGKAINSLFKDIEESEVVLVTIVTDGYENASREYTQDAIRALVEEMKTKGWVFTYIGANQDVESVAMSISINNHLQFNANMAETKQMWERENRNRKKFFSRVSDANESPESLQKDYFSEL